MVVKMATRKSKKATAAPAAPTAPAAPATPPVSGREYTWHDSISGWEAARVGYVRQQEAKAQARAAAMAGKPKTREQLMDEAAAKTFREMDVVNAGAKEFTRKVMPEPASAWDQAGGRAGPGGGEPWRNYMGPDGPVAPRRRGW
jgi:hypothetical protein